MKIYLAASFARREEMEEYRHQLIDLGHDVTSYWIVRDPVPYESLNPTQRMYAAIQDHVEVTQCDMLVQFSSVGIDVPTHGGRHTEFGIALEGRKHLVLVGECEQIFHHLPQVRQYRTWEQFINALNGVGSPWK